MNYQRYKPITLETVVLWPVFIYPGLFTNNVSRTPAPTPAQIQVSGYIVRQNIQETGSGPSSLYAARRYIGYE